MNDVEVLRTRVKKLAGSGIASDPQCVLYVTSRDLRTHANFGLLAAQAHALQLKLPLVVLFVAIDRRVGQRSREQITFLLDGLPAMQAELARHGVSFILRNGQPHNEWMRAADELQPAGMYFDFSPLRGPRSAYKSFADAAPCPVFVVDSHNVIPVWVASNKQEVGARTLRPKINYHLPTYLRDGLSLQQHPHQFSSKITACTVTQLKEQVLQHYPVSGVDITRYKSGQIAAVEALDAFIAERLSQYQTDRNDPSKLGISDLSPYLHYGFISSLQVALAAYEVVKADSNAKPSVDSIIEEMIVRKELSDNFCYYNPNYESLEGAPQWAQASLAKHADDPREFIYSLAQFEAAQTHDTAWNAAQTQLTRTGKIHGYMRMYWAKKVLEWSNSPQEALATLLYLNDFYHIDGGDPNGYVGILWSIAGLHDRPWGERPVYGVIRSMVFSGLKRKFDIQAYINQFS